MTPQQSHKLQTLCTPSGDPFPVHIDPILNSSTGTVSIPMNIIPADTPFSDCASDILALLQGQDFTACDVQCYSLPSRGKRTTTTHIARISFTAHDLPTHVIIGGERLPVRPYSPPPRQCQNCWRFGHPAKFCRSPYCCPLCAQPDHSKDDCPSTSHHCPNCGENHNAFSRGCPAYKFEAEVALIRHQQGLSLPDAVAHMSLHLFLQCQRAPNRHHSDEIRRTTNAPRFYPGD